MATIKSYTDISQSKKLAEFLSFESADMYYPNRIDIKYQGALPIEFKRGNPLLSQEIAAWSLTALYGILPNNKHITTTLSRGGWKIEPVEYIDKWFCEYENEVDEDSPCKNFSVSADNPVDACYEMIIKLKERNLI